jgi:PleD family two-component response regulator
VSLGLASLDAHDTLAGLLDRADQALYDAKGAGRNTVASRGEPFAR